MKNPYLLLPVLAGVFWGTAGIFIRTLTAYGMDPQTLLFCRVAMATVLMTAYLLIYDKNLLKIRLRDLGLMYACAVTGTLALNLCYVRAIEELSLSLAAVLLALCPVFVIFMAAVIFKEKLTGKKLFCAGLALAGCLLVSGILETDGLQWTWTGIILGLGAAVCYAMYSIVSKITMARGYNVFTIVFYSVLMTAVTMAPFVDWDITIQYVGGKTAGHVLFLVAYALCTAILPYVIFTFALNHAEAGKVSILASGGEPVAASITGMLVFSEIPTVLSVIGLVITIAALAYLCYAEENDMGGKQCSER